MSCVCVRDEGSEEGRRTKNRGKVCFHSSSEKKRLMTVSWRPYLHASCARAGEVLIGLYLGALVVHWISSAAHCRLACGFVLLRAVGALCCFCCVFFSPKKTKLDCDKYVAPNRNMQHLLSNFIWRSYTVNYTGYAITLCFNYIALTCGRAASLNLVMEQGGNRKESIWCNSLLQTNAVFGGPGRGRKDLIFHIMMTSERQLWKAKSLCTS